VSKTTLFNLDFFSEGLSAALEVCHQAADSGQGSSVAFVNVHTLMESVDDPEFYRLLKSFSFRMPDGMPLSWLSKIKGTPVQEKVSGPDFMEAFLSEFSTEPQGFIGGREGQAEIIAQEFGIQESVSYCPPFRDFTVENAREDWNEFLKLCKGGTPPLWVWVGLGAPKQEQWIQAVASLAPQTSFFGVGAAFDFLSGSKARAPEWMQKSGLEWAHRLMSEPKRLGMRYLKTNGKFLARCLGEIRRKT
jgi:N-acetylglucosaminyldiphosphoundecaprenol N-acetyl-beta-D-mannosaminyltransferase